MYIGHDQSGKDARRMLMRGCGTALVQQQVVNRASLSSQMACLHSSGSP